MANGCEFHWLRGEDGDLDTPVCTEASTIVLQLEARGVLLAVDGDEIVAIPRRLLTDEDRGAIRALRRHVIRFLAYRAPLVH